LSVTMTTPCTYMFQGFRDMCAKGPLTGHKISGIKYTVVDGE